MIRYVVLLFLSALLCNCLAYGFTVSKIQLDCAEGYSCNEFEGKFDPLLGTWDEAKLRDRLRLFLFDPSIQKFSFEIREEEGTQTGIVKITPHRIVRSLQFLSNYSVDLLDLKKNFPYREGDLFDETKNQEANAVITRFLAEHGFNYDSISLDLLTQETQVDLIYKINIRHVTKINKIHLDFDTPILLEPIQTKFNIFRGQVWDQLKFKVLVELTGKELFDQGYFYSKLEIRPPENVKNKDAINLTVKGELGERYVFSFLGQRYFSEQELLGFIKTSIKETPTTFDVNEISNDLKKEYEKLGIYNTEITYQIVKGKDRYNSPLNQVHLKIKEGSKILLQEVAFSGNNDFSTEKVQDFFSANSSVLTARGLLDVENLNNFSSVLRKKYFSSGHALAEVSEPSIVFDESHRNARVEYKIKEHVTTQLQDIVITGLQPNLAEKILKILHNKKKQALDVTIIQDDLSAALHFLREEGYYFSRLKNLESDDLLIYSPDSTSATLTLDFDSGKKAIIDGFLVTGTQRTKNKVIMREVEIHPGDILVPSQLEELKDRLTSLGLFSFVRISPLVVDDKNETNEQIPVSILIQVKERNFKSVELAPGYRTDLGSKLSARFVNNNIAGMNRTVIVQAQSNLRSNSSGLDSTRQAQNVRLLEYQLDSSFIEPYLFGKALESETNGAWARKRFYSFDAQVSRFSTQLSKTFKKVLTASLKYQLEIVSQSNATVSKDQGYFRIGGLTPALTLDLRDNRINPRKGASFSLSCEFANPYFYSMKEPDIEINFYRLISRNKFYIPISNNWNIASSLAWGQEVNLSTAMRKDETGTSIKRGYIPGIKVFRLDGVDTVRGYADGEINRLNRPTRPDISKVRIENAAYFTSLKFEPRYLISDTSMIGVFLDAGRVYVDSFEASDLRSSVGLSFKVLTPVGSLDFDYGIKTHRMMDDAGQQEAFGHFHLSIGYF